MLDNIIINPPEFDFVVACGIGIISIVAEYKALYPPDAFAATTPTPDMILKRFLEGPIWVAVMCSHRVRVRVAFSQGQIVRPLQFEAALQQFVLEVRQVSLALVHLAGELPMFKAMRGQRARSFANIPFNRVQAVTAVRDVCHPNVLARG
jgi:hypothetical protein